MDNKLSSDKVVQVNVDDKGNRVHPLPEDEKDDEPDENEVVEKDTNDDNPDETDIVKNDETDNDGAVDMNPEKYNQMNENNDELMNFLGVRPEQFEGNEDEMPPAFRFLEKYFPEENSMGEKTRYRSDEVAIKLTVLKMLPKIYPELTEIEGFDAQALIDGWIDNFDKRLTSVQGESRTEFKEILKSMLGGMRAMNQKGDNGIGGLMQKMFATGGEENEG